MAVVVVGGHSRNVGKTSVVAGLIAALRDWNWTAIKITQYGHSVCAHDGGDCACRVEDPAHSFAITEEHDRSGRTDTSRFLVSGAQRSLWVRTRQGFLAEAMPAVRAELAASENVILESNSVMRFIHPDLYITVLDPHTPDFKDSARTFLDRADAVLLHNLHDKPAWTNISLRPVAGKPAYAISEGHWTPPELIEFVRDRLTRQQPVFDHLAAGKQQKFTT